jgi:hypothetical protein
MGNAEPRGLPEWLADAGMFEVPVQSVRGVASPSECDFDGRPRLSMQRGFSREVCGSSSTTHLPSPLIPGLPRPVRSVSRVSHPPDGFLLDRLPALFHAGALMEFQPYRAFPSPGAVTPLGARYLPAVHRRRRIAGPTTARREAIGRAPREPRRGSTSRSCSPGRVRDRVASRQAGDWSVALLGFRPLQGIPPRVRSPRPKPLRILPRASSEARAAAEADVHETLRLPGVFTIARLAVLPEYDEPS